MKNGVFPKRTHFIHYKAPRMRLSLLKYLITAVCVATAKGVTTTTLGGVIFTTNPPTISKKLALTQTMMISFLTS